MSSELWFPALLMLLLGLLGGWVAVRRMPRRSSLDAEKRLSLEDLQVRRDEIFERLRAPGEVAGAERLALEHQAARVLRDIDRLRDQDRPRTEPEHSPRDNRRGKGGELSMDETKVDRGAGGRRQLVVGFAAGLASTVLLGALIFWAMRDSGVSGSGVGSGGAAGSEVGNSGVGGGGAAGAASGAGADMPPQHDTSGDLNPEVAAKVADLRSQLAATPGDLARRKELAVLLLGSNQMVPAFEEAGKILAARPEDPDGLYVHGVVRLAMGQADRSIDLLDQVLSQYPEHVLALLARGKALLRLGNTPLAIASWERGLAAAGGQHREIEWLLAEARGGQSPQEILRTATPLPAMAGPMSPSAMAGAMSPSAMAGPTSPSAMAGPTSPSAMAGPTSPSDMAGPTSPPKAASMAAAADGYSVRVELAAGVWPPAGAVLFASLRGPAGGPPIAARKIIDPTFPIELSLGPGDSMMGQPLPERGRLTVRLDRDGSATTHDSTDLSAEAELAMGDSIKLVLGQ